MSITTYVMLNIALLFIASLAGVIGGCIAESFFAAKNEARLILLESSVRLLDAHINILHLKIEKLELTIKSKSLH